MSEDEIEPARANRRQVLKTAAVVGLAASVVSRASAQDSLPSQGETTFPAEGQAYARMGSVSGQLFWDVETTNGRVQGVANGNGRIKQFKGIPYGAPTGGLNRYQPPKRPQSWTGIRECFGYGQISPQVPMQLDYDYAAALYWDLHVGLGGMGDDCLNLNVWSPGVNDEGKRPVLVHFHGGGWSTGSANGPMYDGARLANFGDVVVVTVNHRLAGFGYANFTDLGAPPEFSSAGVCGVQDMVASLEWVRENIEKFGGDPDRVLIYGQSGGGAKTSTLLATPSAEGLFQRAIVQSGSALRLQHRADGARSAELLLRELGISPGPSISEIWDKSWQEILVAQSRSGADFRPVVDGRVVPQHPFDPVAPSQSKNVPLIIGTTLHDRSNAFENFDIDDAELLKIFERSWGQKAKEILAAYRAESPEESTFRIQGKAYTDAGRGDAMLQAQRKAAQHGAPAYHYVWDWSPALYDKRYGALHAADLDSSFFLERSPVAGSGNGASMLMSKRIAATFVEFAATGNPNNSEIPAWPAYDASRRATMVFDEQMKVIDDYRGDFVRLIGDTGPTTVRI